MARIGTSGNDPYQLPPGKGQSLPAVNRKLPAPTDAGVQARKKESQTVFSATDADRSVATGKGVAGAAARTSVANAYAAGAEGAAANARYTLHSVPWEAGTYHSKQAIDLYQQNQRLPTSAAQTIEMLPRVNEQI